MDRFLYDRVLRHERGKLWVVSTWSNFFIIYLILLNHYHWMTGIFRIIVEKKLHRRCSTGFQTHLWMMCTGQCETLYAIWYHLNNLKNVKNIHWGVLLLVKLHALAFNFTKSNTPPWAFFTNFILYKWYQIAQILTVCLPFLNGILSYIWTL